MNEIGMTMKDVLKRIEKEEKYLKKCNDDLAGIKFDIKATKRCICWWKKELRRLEKKSAKKDGAK